MTVSATLVLVPVRILTAILKKLTFLVEQKVKSVQAMETIEHPAVEESQTASVTSEKGYKSPFACFCSRLLLNFYKL